MSDGRAGAAPPVWCLLPDVAATESLGRRLAGLLRAGDVVVLDGPLGAGKTVLARGVAAGLGVRGRVTSPTFVLARQHRPGASGPSRREPLGLVHVDAYRLLGEDPDAPGPDAAEALADLDLDLGAAVAVVEWGGGLVADLAPAGHLQVELSRDEDDRRTARLSGHGPRWAGVDLDDLLRPTGDDDTRG